MPVSISCTKSFVVTRDQLRALPAPIVPSETFRPVPHIELVETLTAAVNGRGLTINQEEFALRRGVAMIFGIMRLSGLDTADGYAALGFRAANNGNLSIQMVAGLSVFVCDNMCFSGDLIALRRKHTSGLNLLEELNGGLGRFLEHHRVLAGNVEKLKQRPLTDGDAKGLIHDAFVRELMPIRLLPEVSRAYFKSPHPEFEPRTAWSLHNAFTEVAKEMPITTRVAAIQTLGRFLMPGAGAESDPEVLHAA
jgi:hypothetical protein